MLTNSWSSLLSQEVSPVLVGYWPAAFLSGTVENGNSKKKKKKQNLNRSIAWFNHQAYLRESYQNSRQGHNARPAPHSTLGPKPSKSLLLNKLDYHINAHIWCAAFRIWPWNILQFESRLRWLESNKTLSKLKGSFITKGVLFDYHIGPRFSTRLCKTYPTAGIENQPS